MGYAVREYVEGYWYHIYTRGQRREPLFFSPEDRIHYLNLLDNNLARRGGNIGSFCLMTNHVHLLLRMGETSLGEILRAAHSKYARDFNAHRGTDGHVTQGRPGVKVILDDKYLHRLVGYIHSNPVEAKIAAVPGEYQWSSWSWFTGEECSWIELKSWEYPPGFDGDDRGEVFHSVTGGGGGNWPGGRKYIGTQKQWDEFERRRQEGREGQAYKERRGRRTKKEIATEIANEGALGVEELQGPSRAHNISGPRRKAMALMFEEGYGTSEIARYFNRTPSTVSQAYKKWKKNKE